MTDQTEPGRSIEICPIWQTSVYARWMVSIGSEQDDDNPWSGWIDVDGNAETGIVDLEGHELTPAEARNLAEALRRAADHAEEFCRKYADMLDDLIFPGMWPELDGLSVETQRAARSALRGAADRYRRRQATKEDGA